MVVALLLLQKIEAIDQSIGTGNEGARCGGVAPFALSLSTSSISSRGVSLAKNSPKILSTWLRRKSSDPQDAMACVLARDHDGGIDLDEPLISPTSGSASPAATHDVSYNRMRR